MMLTKQKSPLAVSLSLSHTDTGLLYGFNFNSDEQPLRYYMRVLPRITHKHRHINSDDFGGHLVLRIEDQERNISNKDVTGM